MTDGNVAAINFGMTSVSLAYTTKGLNGVCSLSLNNEERITSVSNTVLFKREGKSISLTALGNRARSQFTRARNYDNKNMIYFEKNKLILGREKVN